MAKAVADMGLSLRVERAADEAIELLFRGDVAVPLTIVVDREGDQKDEVDRPFPTAGQGGRRSIGGAGSGA